MKPDVQEQVKLLLTYADADVRRMAAIRLGSTRDEKLIDALIAALQDDHSGVREAAAKALVEIGTPSVARAVTPYLESPITAFRNLVAKVLTGLGGHAVSTVTELLQHTDKDVRKFSADILGEIHNTGSCPHLINLLHDADPNVVVAATEALGSIGCSAAVGPLCNVFVQHPFAKISVVDALRRIGDARASDFLLKEFTEKIGTSKSDPLLVLSIIEALAQVGDLRAMGVLTACFYDVDGIFRHMLIHSIVCIAERHAERFDFWDEARIDLFAALQSPNMEITVSAVKGLLHLQGYDVTQALVRALGMNEDLDFLLYSELLQRNNIFCALLGALEEGCDRAKPHVIALIARIVELEGRNGNGGLSESPSKGRVFDIIAGQWETENEELGISVLELLFRIDRARATALMERWIGAANPWIRARLAELLGDQAAEQSSRWLRQLADDDDELVRDVAQSFLYRASSEPTHNGILGRNAEVRP